MDHSGSQTANTNPKITSAYNLLLGNKQMIIDETIAYMSSSWSSFDYNEALCRRDLGYIIDGAAYDLLYGGNSASLVNGKFYLEYPSQADAAQLNQTLDGIRFASRITQKIAQNITFVTASESRLGAYNLLKDNKDWIKEVTIAKINKNVVESGR